jgi:uncharacterized protein YqfB (UPF0267 family)
MINEIKSGFAFADNLVPLILNNSKTFTYRLGDKYDHLQTGDVCRIRDASTREPFAVIEILNKSTVRFADLPIDRKGHEPYPSKEAMRQTFESYYQHPVTDDEPVLVFQFKMIETI